LRFDSVAQYVEGWRRYPAFVHAWNEDVEAYARYDMVSDGRSVGCVVSEEAVRFDGYDLLTDEDTRTALDRVRAPIRVMRAARGLRDDNQRMLPDVGLEPFRRAHPEVVIEDMPDVNHYTMVLGAGHGPQLVAAAIEAAAREPARGSAAPPAW
jgi:lipase